MTILHCAICDQPFRSRGAIPLTCPICEKPTRWTTTPRTAVSLPPYVLTEHDIVFLRQQRIAPS